jgi:hypothetical protein
MQELDDRTEPLFVGVRALPMGNRIYITGSRPLSVDLGRQGPFDMRITLQANVPAGSYLIEVGALDLLKRKEFATAPSMLLRVTESTAFLGTVQFNAVMRPYTP